MELMTDKLKTDWHYAIYEHLATIGEGPVAPTPRIAVFQPPARGHRLSSRAAIARTAKHKLPAGRDDGGDGQIQSAMGGGNRLD